MIHILAWIILFTFPLILITRDEGRESRFLLINYVQTLFYCCIFYVNYLWLIPRLFFRQKRLVYLLVAVLLIVAAALLTEGISGSLFSPRLEEGRFHGPPPGGPGPDKITGLPVMPDIPAGTTTGGGPHPVEKKPAPSKGWPVYNFILISALVTGVSLGLRFSGQLIQKEKERKEAEKEKINTELTMLKHQINPHFLFNTLNSIYSLALLKSDQTAEAVMKLSDMMRYVIQDVKSDRVPLGLETCYIGHYVELQRLRLAGNMDILFDVEGNLQPYRIAPMILIPFVENAFKYGTTSHGNATILIGIRMEEPVLHFKVSNQIFEGREQNETFGIGVRNTRKRLQLIYPGQHELRLINNGHVYVVTLTIRLK
ncbi:MAG: sensor histidine kinase [Bacteroidales bacterium]|nr:sensor histidine kinase [Bacteroidales bacterium]